jgi:hypothetical protein
MSLRAALIQQCAATLTELECYGLDDDAVRVLPHCRRLESLTFCDIFWKCPPAAWLGLSQLHTLRGVSFCDVPAAAIAAALPRLHTLHLHHDEEYVDFPVAAFYGELLPRLRSFHLEGRWPTTGEEPEMADVPPLPLLEDLNWRAGRVNLPRRLMGARPSVLNISGVVLFEWLKTGDIAGSDSAASTSPLARVRALTLRIARTLPDAAFMPLLLRAAPQLRQLAFEVLLCDHMRWVLSDECTPEPAFAPEAAHPRLRHVIVTSMCALLDVPVPDGCGVRLRQRHFPCLRRFTVDDEEYPVWVARRAGRRKTFRSTL